MGMFDQNARAAAKQDGAAFCAWLLRRYQPPPPLAFERWDDSRRLPLPGGPDRTDDLVAVLRRTDAPGQVVYMIVEVESEPERHLLQRLGIYGLLLSREVSPPPGPEDEPPVGCVLINLTGERPEGGLALAVAGTPLGLGVKPLVMNLCREEARQTLTDIAASHVGLSILPWVPLMAGGGEPALIEEWKQVALREPDAGRRATYRDMALVFAELTRELINWQRGLEGWEMKESQYIKGWLNQGKVQGVVERGRSDLLKLLRAKLHDPVPEEVRLAIEGTNDPGTLDRWYDAALQAGTWPDFRAAMRNGA
ncbi:MAG TPA: hypothetical protein VKA46_40995 [Gemmataceae bacterium]|nr:hypothetical protein [Gemmataceae bacterium]